MDGKTVGGLSVLNNLFLCRNYSCDAIFCSSIHMGRTIIVNRSCALVSAGIISALLFIFLFFFCNLAGKSLVNVARNN